MPHNQKSHTLAARRRSHDQKARDWRWPTLVCGLHGPAEAHASDIGQGHESERNGDLR